MDDGRTIKEKVIKHGELNGSEVSYALAMLVMIGRNVVHGVHK